MTRSMWWPLQAVRRPSVVWFGCGLVFLLLTVGCSVPVAGKPVAEPAASTTTSAPAAPKTIPDADLMARIRATDLCALHDVGFIQSSYGPRVHAELSDNMSGCTVYTAGSSRSDWGYIFGLIMPVKANDRDIVAEVSHGHPVNRSTVTDNTEFGIDTCYYELRIPGSSFAAKVRVRRLPPDRQPAVLWPERCQVAQDYVGRIADAVIALAPRTQPLESRTLRGKDPCAPQPQVVALMPGWQAEPPQWTGAYRCKTLLRKPGEKYIYELELEYRQDVEPATTKYGARPYSTAGLSGMELPPDLQPGTGFGDYCTISLVYRPENPRGRSNAHMVELVLHAEQRPYAFPAPPLPLDACPVAEQMMPLLVQAAG